MKNTSKHFGLLETHDKALTMELSEVRNKYHNNLKLSFIIIEVAASSHVNIGSSSSENTTLIKERSIVEGMTRKITYTDVVKRQYIRHFNDM